MSQLPASSFENATGYCDLRHIRQRPGMYIGDTGVSGLHHVLFELIYNSVDEFSESQGDRIHVEFLADGGCRVQDHGRGIPLELGESAFTTRDAHGRSKDAKYACQGGLHGIGLKAVTALSRRLRAEIARDGQLWHIEFERGAATTPLTAVKPMHETGTTITFWPDPEIFTSQPTFELQSILERLTELAFLNPGLRFVARDDRCTPLFQREICYPIGLRQRVEELNRTRLPVHPTVFYCQEQADDHELEIALQWTLADAELLQCFVNNYRTRSPGTPETGFHRALSATIGRFGRATGLLPDQPDGEMIRTGVTAILSVKVRNPVWQAATKSYLANPEIRSFVETTLNKNLAEFLYGHPEEGDAICGQIMLKRGS